MNNLNNKQHITFGLLRRFKSEKDLSINLAISEFIDNSIENFELNPSNSNSLEIDIYYFKDTSKYWIIDNANGIDGLQKAMQLFKNTYAKSSTSKNQYGYGMKSGIFYIGANGKIYTKLENEEYAKIGEFKPEINDPGKNINNNDDISECDVIYDVQNINVNDLPDVIRKRIHKHGTCIEITDVYNRRGLTDQKLEELCCFLGYRFGYYLEDNQNFKTEIKIWFGDTDNFKNPKTVMRYSSMSSVSKYSDLRSNYENKNELELKVINKQEYKYDELREYYQKLFNDEKLIFNTKINVITDDNQVYKMPIKIGFINPNSIKNKKEWHDKILKNSRGVSIIHSNRFICHPGATESENNLYKFYEKDKDFSGYWRWLYGELSLNDIPTNENCKDIKPDKNKRGVIFENTSIISEENFKNALYKYVYYIFPFLRFLISLCTDNINKERIKTDINISQKNNNLARNLEYDEERDITILNPEKDNILSYLTNNSKKLVIKTINEPNNELVKLVEENENEYVYEYNESLNWTKEETILTNLKLLLVYLDLGFHLNKNNISKVSELIQNIMRLLHDNKN